MSPENRVFFIVSAPRSASTAIATICNEATNCICEIEPDEASNFVTRLLMDGIPTDVAKWIGTVKKRILEGLAKADIYGEKDVVYGPMIPWLYNSFGCKFVYLVRNRQDTVRSMMRWQQEVTGCIYRECKDRGPMSKMAEENEKNWEGRDTCDYSRPRPLPGDYYYENWSDLPFHVMCGYYYDRLREIYQAALKWVPPHKKLRIDIDSPMLADDVFKMTEWLGLKGLSLERISTMLDSRINAVDARKEGKFCLD